MASADASRDKKAASGKFRTSFHCMARGRAAAGSPAGIDEAGRTRGLSARYGIARPTVSGADTGSFEFAAAGRPCTKLQCGCHDDGPFQTACSDPLSLIKWLQLADRDLQDPHSVGQGRDAHQGHFVRHEHPNTGRLRRDGAQSEFKSHATNWRAVVHRHDVRRDGFGVFRAVRKVMGSRRVCAPRSD